MWKYLKHNLLLMMLAVISAPPLFSELSKKESSFYAISSLCHHINTTLSDPSKDIFSTEEVSDLWNSASEGNQVKAIVSARDLYYQSQKENEDQANLLLTEAQIILENAWKKSNPYLENPNSSISKGRNDYKKIHDAVKVNYLLPENSLLRASLDKIFTTSAMLENPNLLFKAGFKVVSKRRSGMYVLKHPLIQGHLIKAHPASKKRNKQNWQWLIFRCWGVTNVQRLIKEKKLKHFVAPNKWIYPLTKYSIGADGDFSKVRAPAVLVVTDMQLASDKECRKAWKKKVTKQHIQELYVILSHGYASCRLTSNIPLTKKGKFACIDTERPERPMHYEQIDPYLSKKMKRYFYRLVKSGGKKIKDRY